VRWIVLRPLRERRDDGILRMILRVWLRLQWHKVECPLPILLPTTLAVWLLSFIVTFREFTPPYDLGGSGQHDAGPAVVAVCGEHRYPEAGAGAALSSWKEAKRSSSTSR
jgi:hypothetical protein